MSEQVVPALLQDPLEFVQSRKTQNGEIALNRLLRLRENLLSQDGAVRYQLSCFVNAQGMPSLRCQVQGELQLACQRCLEPMDYRLDVDNALLLLQHEPDAMQADDPDAPDYLLIQRDLVIADLVEEEIMLALPMAPHHAEAVCKGRPATETGKLHPFAALARLKTIKE